MRLLVLSDLHHEVWRDAPEQAREILGACQPNIRQSQPDVVILAGDIDVGDLAVAWADQAFPDLPVIYVHGNHEGYGQKLDAVRGRLSQACKATGHIHFLNRGELVLNGVRFLGATLWTDFRLLGEDSFQEAMQAAASGLNDYRKIRLTKGGYRKLKPLDTLQWHVQDRIWLKERLDQTFSGPTVVVTHMAPSGRSIPVRYRGELLSAAFASELDELVTKADLWVHGHVHDSMDYRIGDARVVCNPLGYPHSGHRDEAPWENLAYDPNFIVEI
ncbi:metallophosphoesterase [Stenotrophomonas indicatrix]|uniref:metallophosphoesterase n=1 Tax=Stenotrophomonas indicatrix TaxID=2045451 RepID=UPI00249B1D4F|nr:metallophosphoesterase [Stenotrophomonas indicatrix]WGV53290.1 metallophosphoesterase [Stenotrophomonas indicatrix]